MVRTKVETVAHKPSSLRYLASSLEKYAQQIRMAADVTEEYGSDVIWITKAASLERAADSLPVFARAVDESVRATLEGKPFDANTVSSDVNEFRKKSRTAKGRTGVKGKPRRSAKKKA